MSEIVREAPSERDLPESLRDLEMRRHRTLFADAARSFRQKTSAMVGLVMIILFLLASLAGILGATPYDPEQNKLRERLESPSRSHIMGTDGFGRDIFSRLIDAAPLALMIGIVAVAIGGLVGTTLGLIAGYFRGIVSTLIMRVTDAMMAFPLLLLALTIIATLGPGLTRVMIAVGIATTPRFVRMMRAETLSVSEREYILAAKAVGVPTWQILPRHIVPNAFASVLVMATLFISTAILTEATLSFLGLGPAPPTATWGSMINAGADVLRSAPWVAFFPGLAITIVVLGFSLIGDGLRDALDTKLQER